MEVLRTSFSLLMITLIILALFGGCSSSPKSENGSGNNSPVVTQATPRGLTGTISLGKTVDAASASISPGGGKITVNQADSLINGLEMMIPSGSFENQRNFKISCAPIEKHSFGEDFSPITPLITVENGGVYSSEDMLVTIPVIIPEGKFAMGFLYNDKTKILEGMPLMAENAVSITVATRHFSSFVISLIDRFKLKQDIDTSFRPGIDDWQFINYGSYIAPKGHCAGQSVSAMWYYYYQPEGKDLTLYNRYDNNGKNPATPDLWWDDSKGYRLASTIQSDLDWDSWASQFFTNQRGVDDELAWDAFAYSMQFLKQPQYVTLAAGEKGHAIICYRIKDGNLYVADPNYPGDTERRIEYVNKKFKPYKSGANKKEIDDGKSISYSKIGYVSQSSRVDWNKMNQRWSEFKSGTIGNDKFPAYKIMTKDEKGQLQEIPDGYVSTKRYIYLDVKADFIGKIYVFIDGKTISHEGNEFRLDAGNNLLGIYIAGKINDAYEYVDYKYLNVMYTDSGSLAIKPDSSSIETGQTQILTVTSSKPASKPSYEWFMGSLSLNIKSTSVKASTDKTYTFDFAQPGTYEIIVREWDEGASPRKLTGGTANATVTVKESGTKRLSLLQKQVGVQLTLTGTHTYKVWQAPDNTTNEVKQGSLSCPQSISGEIRSMPISWSGTGFTGIFTNGGLVYTLNGNVSSDGTTLTNLTYSFVNNSKGTYQYSDTTVKIAVAGGIPIWGIDGTPSNTISNAEVAKYIINVSDVYNNYYTGGEKRDTRLYVSSDWTKGTIRLSFVSQLDNFVTGSNGNFTVK
jgi:hypothetical protein